MPKAKGKKPVKSPAAKAKPGAKATKKQPAELSDDELKRVSGGVGLSPGTNQTLNSIGISNEKWIEGTSAGWIESRGRGGST